MAYPAYGIVAGISNLRIREVIWRGGLASGSVRLMTVLCSCSASADVYSEHPVSWTPIQIVDCYCKC
jgi:hypothetical protein